MGLKIILYQILGPQTQVPAAFCLCSRKVNGKVEATILDGHYSTDTDQPEMDTSKFQIMINHKLFHLTVCRNQMQSLTAYSRERGKED